MFSRENQGVRYQGETSDWIKLNGGVPQGTRIGPLGFVTMVNDVASDTSLTSLKYVDDLTMQDHLDELENWAAVNHMKLNPEKCASMQVSFMKHSPVQQSPKIANVTLQTVEVAKILGVHIRPDLKWDSQIAEMLKKANGRLYLLKLLKRFKLPMDDLITIFSGFVCPLAEYAAPVWHPGLTAKESAALERVQRRACKIILGNQYTQYDEALELCKNIHIVC
ncbi:uncharacterized protein [Asterias amurensis]|uniref:uncharacterized protein n=1 Tax=Asterias amurensis TaxID=7602 RepID=UPI003AB80DE8